MTDFDKAGRNDPCPCGSGKKFKNCCIGKQKSSTSTASGIKKINFKAKVLTKGPEELKKEEQSKQQPMPMQSGIEGVKMVDYNLLMERSFGSAIHTREEKPPMPSDPNQYKVSE